MGAQQNMNRQQGLKVQYMIFRMSARNFVFSHFFIQDLKVLLQWHEL